MFLRTTIFSAMAKSFRGISIWVFTKFATKRNYYDVQRHEMTKQVAPVLFNCYIIKLAL